MKVTVPRAEALITALGQSARDSLVTLAKAIAQEIQDTNESDKRHAAIRTYLQVLRDINTMDRDAVRRTLTEARTNWVLAADPNGGAGPTPKSSLIDELRAKREAHDGIETKRRDGSNRVA